MMNGLRTAIAAACVLLVIGVGPSFAQAEYPIPPNTTIPTPPGNGSTIGVVQDCVNSAGQAVPNNLGGCVGGVPVAAMAPAGRHFPGCTVGTSSASCLAASTAVNFLQIQNPPTNAVNVACAFGSTAVLGGAGSVMLAPGQSASWGPMTGGVPSGQMNCIAGAASTPLYVEWN